MESWDQVFLNLDGVVAVLVVWLVELLRGIHQECFVVDGRLFRLADVELQEDEVTKSRLV